MHGFLFACSHSRGTTKAAARCKFSDFAFRAASKQVPEFGIAFAPEIYTSRLAHLEAPECDEL